MVSSSCLRGNGLRSDPGMIIQKDLGDIHISENEENSLFDLRWLLHCVIYITTKTTTKIIDHSSTTSKSTIDDPVHASKWTDRTLTLSCHICHTLFKSPFQYVPITSSPMILSFGFSFFLWSAHKWPIKKRDILCIHDIPVIHIYI